MTETLRFRKIYLEDLQTGTGTDDVVLADGRIAALTRINVTDIPLRTYTLLGLPSAGTLGRLATLEDDTGGVVLDTATQWAHLFSRFINPKFHPFNAKGDGTTDDAAAFTNALAAGNIIVEPTAAHYLIGSAITVPSNRTIMLLAGATLKAKNVAWAGAGVLSLNSVSNVQILGNGVLDGDKANNATGTILGVKMLDSSQVTIQGITCQNFPASTAAGGNAGDGIYIGGTTTNGSSNVKVLGVTCDGNVRQGISIVKGSRIKVIGSDILNTTGTNPGAGIDIEPNAPGDILQHITVQGNHFSGNHHGVFVSGSGPTIAIAGNTFAANDGADIVVTGTDVAITGNAIDMRAKGGRSGVQLQRGILVYDGDHVSIVGNQLIGLSAIDANSRSGIAYGKGVTNLTIVGNSIRGIAGNGISGWGLVGTGATSGVVIQGNVLEDCVWQASMTNTAGMRIGDTGMTLTDVIVTDNIIRDTRSGTDRMYWGLELVGEDGTWTVFNNKVVNYQNAATGEANASGFGTSTGILTARAVLDFDLTAVTTHDLTIAVPGAALGDSVALGVPNGSLTADTLFYAWVSATDTVTVRAMRTAGTPNPASGAFKVTVFTHT